MLEYVLSNGVRQEHTGLYTIITRGFHTIHQLFLMPRSISPLDVCLQGQLFG